MIGQAITERPDLFAAAQISVGCTDMVRFETTMNGPPHQIKDGTKYPAVLLTHGINDPRVQPWESAKTSARLQAATGSNKPFLFRVDYNSEHRHNIGSTKQRQDEQADMWSFLLWQFGDVMFRPQ